MFKKVRASIVNTQRYCNNELHALAEGRYIRTIWVVKDEREIIDPKTKQLFQHIEEIVLDNANGLNRLRYKDDWTLVDGSVRFHIRGLKEQNVEILIELFMIEDDTAG